MQAYSTKILLFTIDNHLNLESLDFGHFYHLKKYLQV